MSSSFFSWHFSFFISLADSFPQLYIKKNIYLSAVSLGIERGLHFSLIMKFSLDWQRKRRISTSWKICLTFCEIIIFFSTVYIIFFSFTKLEWIKEAEYFSQKLSKAAKICACTENWEITITCDIWSECAAIKQEIRYDSHVYISNPDLIWKRIWFVACDKCVERAISST